MRASGAGAQNPAPADGGRIRRREYQQAATYHAYAKELCENYNFDLRKYRFCVNQKRYAAITKSDFGKLKEDLCFLDNALTTVLADYRDYFRERFVDGLSIRKYASAHLLNRGRVDYLQKKFLSALARLLKEGQGGWEVPPETNSEKLNRHGFKRGAC